MEPTEKEREMRIFLNDVERDAQHAVNPIDFFEMTTTANFENTFISL